MPEEVGKIVDWVRCPSCGARHGRVHSRFIGILVEMPETGIF